MNTDRSSTAHAAARFLGEAASRLGSLHAVVGFDAFIDSIIHVVDQRFAMTPEGFTRIETIGQFAARAAAAAGKSTNLEMVEKERRFGGNGPLMAGALGRAGMQVTYVGAVGRPDAPRQLHPIYEEFAARCQLVVPVAPPATTDALEFEDGKIMLGKPANIQGVTWDVLKSVIGVDQIVERFNRASLVGMVNWVMMGGVEGIWTGLCEEVFPKLAEPAKKRVFIDLCDPAKRTDADIMRAVKLLQRMNSLIPVTLGLNQAEAERIAKVVGAADPAGQEMQTLGMAMRSIAVEIQKKTGLNTIVVHPREGAAAANMENQSAWFEGPFTRTPKLSTGAGDHFNAGFALGQTIGMPLEQSLALGCATSGAYVRDAESPTVDRLVEFLSHLPPGESHS
ncbi:MAG TPA: carbohydrate kinase family protein [Phycisphaerales bacterium]|nr:carbohydrate kinase family protein [Phycisphaerales bacterium]